MHEVPRGRKLIALRRGELETAEESARAGLDLARERLPRGSSGTSLMQVQLGRVRLAMDRPEEALTLVSEGCAALLAQRSLDALSLASCLEAWVQALLETGDRTTAAEKARELLALTPLDSPQRAEREALLEQALSAPAPVLRR